jgi:hypothetical protein
MIRHVTCGEDLEEPLGMKLGGPQSQPILGGVHLLGVEPLIYPAHIRLLC